MLFSLVNFFFVTNFSSQLKTKTWKEKEKDKVKERKKEKKKETNKEGKKERNANT